MGFFTDLISKVLNEAGEIWTSIFVNFGEAVFFIEKEIGNVFSTEQINNIYLFVSSFAISMILLKMLKKGFMTYILWRDGDPDAPVQQTVVNLVLAVVIVILFPLMYQWYAEVSVWLIENVILKSLGMIGVDSMVKWVANLLESSAKSLVFAIVCLIYVIMMFVIYIQLIKRSAELLVLRLGFPLACLGLLDSDNGVFTSTVKVFIQVSLSTTIQLFFMDLSIMLFLSGKGGVAAPFYCIAFCSAALGAPKLLQFITLPQGGGGGAMYKVTSTVHTVSMIKSLLPK